MSRDSPVESTTAHLAPLAAGGTALTIFGELDLATEPEVRGVLDEALSRSGPMLIDLRACGFVDSTGIALLAHAAITLKREGRELTLRGVQARVMRIFDISGLSADPSITIEPAPEPTRDEPEG